MSAEQTSRAIPRAGYWLLALYLAVAPIYWLPGVDLTLWRGAKLALFALAVGTVFMGVLADHRDSKVRLPRGLAGPLGFAALVAVAVPGLAQTANPARVAMFLMDIAYGALFLWCFYNVARADEQEARRILVRSLLLIAGFVTVAMAYTALGLSGWQSPCGTADFATTGFACKRVAWSNALALYLCIALAFAVRRDLAWDNRWCYIGIALLLLAAQVLSGGRGGIVASLVALGVFAVLLLPWRVKLVGVAVVLAAIMLVPAVELSDEWQRRLRLDVVPERPQSVADWDYYSAGRVSQILVAVEAFRERPFVGHGIGAVTANFRGTDFEIHNLWLKWATNFGVLAPLILLVLAGSVLTRAWRLLWRSSVGYKSTVAAGGLIVVAGLVASMFGGETLLGEFQNTALWWAALGLVLGTAAKDREPTEANPATEEATRRV